MNSVLKIIVIWIKKFVVFLFQKLDYSLELLPFTFNYDAREHFLSDQVNSLLVSSQCNKEDLKLKYIPFVLIEIVRDDLSLDLIKIDNLLNNILLDESNLLNYKDYELDSTYHIQLLAPVIASIDSQLRFKINKSLFKPLNNLKWTNEWRKQFVDAYKLSVLYPDEKINVLSVLIITR